MFIYCGSVIIIVSKPHWGAQPDSRSRCWVLHRPWQGPQGYGRQPRRGRGRAAWALRGFGLERGAQPRQPWHVPRFAFSLHLTSWLMMIQGGPPMKDDAKRASPHTHTHTHAHTHHHHHHRACLSRVAIVNERRIYEVHEVISSKISSGEQAVQASGSRAASSDTVHGAGCARKRRRRGVSHCERVGVLRIDPHAIRSSETDSSQQVAVRRVAVGD